MIDIENQVFTRIATALRAAFPNITVESKTTFMPSAFPCVCIEEAESSSYRRSRDTGSNENHIDVMYEVNVYSSKLEGAKIECKQIFNLLDEEMNSMGFTRRSKNPIPIDNEPISYRINGRYEAVVGKNQTIYRR